MQVSRSSVRHGTRRSLSWALNPQVGTVVRIKIIPVKDRSLSGT